MLGKSNSEFHTLRVCRNYFLSFQLSKYNVDPILQQQLLDGHRRNCTLLEQRADQQREHQKQEIMVTDMFNVTLILYLGVLEN